MNLYILLLYISYSNGYKPINYYLNEYGLCKINNNNMIISESPACLGVYNFDNHNNIIIYKLSKSVSSYGNIYLDIIINNKTILLCTWTLLYNYIKLDNNDCLICEINLLLSKYFDNNTTINISFLRTGYNKKYINYSSIINLNDIKKDKIILNNNANNLYNFKNYLYLYNLLYNYFYIRVYYKNQI
ncbi:hypothetical protein CHBEV_057 [Choristoneura biennis entomopoxvirus]|uniref:Uncharacterized protein n=1 Tax=Choristoneura biennis entomopoxvirus TaxID=10288 RepID=A0A916KPF5_CBEPV|nr:hypothetical protein CHBEV_057 [Choristoneura biennis entomopoxvirus]CCU55625.1 hypothetical protein CHBEV_057 [Choristoneura biennis entomopoxvirus]